MSDFKENQICFLVFDIARSTGKSNIKLTQTNIVDGKIKPHAPILENVDKLIFTIIDDEHSSSSYILEHPLFKRMEHSHEDNGLSSQNVTLPHNEFFMRLPIHERSRYLIISESLEGAAPIELITYKFIKK